MTTTPITTDLSRLLAGVAGSPDDQTIRLVAADAAEESGDDMLARALRWMARRGKRPFPRSANSLKCWYDGDRDPSSGNDPESDLPHGLFALLAGYAGCNRVVKRYPTTLAAELALHAAFALAVVGGWDDAEGRP